MLISIITRRLPKRRSRMTKTKRKRGSGPEGGVRRGQFGREGGQGRGGRPGIVGGQGYGGPKEATEEGKEDGRGGGP